MKHDPQTAYGGPAANNPDARRDATPPSAAGQTAALDALHSKGIRIVMLTGDNRTTAQAVAAKLGITEVEASLRLRVARI